MKLSHVLMRSAKRPPDFLAYVDSASNKIDYSNSTTYTASLPLHTAGDLLVVFLQQRWIQSGGGNAPSVSSGWTLQGQQLFSGEGNACRVYTKIAESSSEVFTATFTALWRFRSSVALNFRSQTGRVPQFAWLDSAYDVHSFPEVTPSAGLQKYTWLPCFAGARDNTAVGTLTMPSGYSTILGPAGGYPKYYGRLAVGLKSTQATSETPGTMVGSGASSFEVTITAAVWEEEG